MSVTVRLTEQEMGIAATIGIYRYLDAMRKNRRQTHGKTARGRWETDIEGCCTELAFAKWVGRYWSGALRANARRGDVGGFEVRSCPLDDARLLLHAADADAAPFVLVTGTAPELTLRGWILGRDGKKTQWWSAPDGRRPCYAVPQAALTPMEELPLTARRL